MKGPVQPGDVPRLLGLVRGAKDAVRAGGSHNGNPWGAVHRQTRTLHVAGNHLESLVAEWYELRGYFIRRNVKVGKRPNGGHECELDVVGFHPEQRSLVQIEPSLDANTWPVREARYAKKFDAGRKYIPGLFPGMAVPKHIDQIALFVYGGGKSRERIAGGRVVFIRDFMEEIRGLRWSRWFGPLEGFVKVCSGSEITPSSSVSCLVIDDDEALWSCGNLAAPTQAWVATIAREISNGRWAPASPTSGVGATLSGRPRDGQIHSVRWDMLSGPALS